MTRLGRGMKWWMVGVVGMGMGVGWGQQADWVTDIKNTPHLDSRSFDWYRTNGSGATGDLSATGAKTVSISKCPKGMAIGLAVRVSGGTGTAEVVELTGSACSAGAAGTISFTTTQTHTGGWRVGTSFGGVPEAVNYLPSTGGMVEMPTGEIKVYKGVTITKSGVTIQGQGVSATRLDIDEMEAGHVFKLSVGASNWLRGFNIGGGGASPHMTGSDYAIIFDDQNSSGVEHVNIAEVTNGIYVNNNTAVSGNYRLWIQYVSIGYLSGANRTGILIEGGADHFLSYIAMGAMSDDLAAIRIRRSGGTTIQNVDVISSGLLIDPDGAGNDVGWIFLNAAMFDTAQNETLKISPTNGARVMGIVATNSWFSSSVTDAGIRLDATLPSQIEDIVFNSCRIFNNATHGIVLDGTGVRDVTISSNLIASNSRLGSGASQGIWIDDARDLVITQNNIGAIPGFFAYQSTGIFFDTGDVDNIIVKDNLIKDYVTTPILGLDTITGLARIIRDNSGSSLVLASVASATVLNLGGEAYEHFTLTGTTSIDTIVPNWYGRQITFTKADGGTINFTTSGNIKTAKTLTTGQTLICVYDIAGWGCVGP